MAGPVNILDLDPESFEVYFREGQRDRTPEQNQFLLEAYRKRQSSLSPFYDAMEATNQAVADEGRRRLNVLPFTVPQGMSFYDAIQAGEQEFAAPGFLMGTAESAANVIDMPSATLRGPVSAEARDQAAVELSEYLLAGAAPAVARAATQGVDPAVLRSAGLIARDNPGGRWLEGKVKAAEREMQEAPANTASSRGLAGSTTAYTPEPILLPVKNVARISGASGEMPRPGTAKYDELLKSVEKEGFRQDRPILIGVNHRGEQYIMEGNNRVAVAAATGQDKIPAVVQWYNGGEEVQGRFSPERVQKLAQEDKQKITSLLP